MANRPESITFMCILFWIFLFGSFIYGLFNLNENILSIILFFVNNFIVLILSLYLWNMKKIGVFLPIFFLIIQLTIIILLFGGIFENEIINYSIAGLYIFSSLGSNIIFLIIALISSKHWNEMDWGLKFWDSYKSAYI